MMAQIADYVSYFNRIRVLKNWFLQLEKLQATIGDNDSLIYWRDTIVNTEFGGDGALKEIASIQVDVDMVIAALGNLKAQIIQYTSNILKTIGEELKVANPSDPAQVMRVLAVAMADDAIDLKNRVPAILAADVEDTNLVAASVSPFTNLGTGKLIYTFVQPNWQTPGERSIEEYMQCDCVSSARSGQEAFQLRGALKNAIISSEGQGSGSGPKLRVAGGSFNNWIFTDWTTNAADNWTADAGAWHTDMLLEASDVYRGAYSCEFIAGGGGKISQQIPTALKPNQMYAIGAWFLKDAGATGDLFMRITNADGVVEIIYLEVGDLLQLDVTSLNDTTWQWHMFIFATQGVIDKTWRLQVDATDITVAPIYIDAIQVIPLTQFNNIWWGLAAGDIDFGIDDNYGYGDANHVGISVYDTAALSSSLHEYLIRLYGERLPVDNAPSEAD